MTRADFEGLSPVTARKKANPMSLSSMRSASIVSLILLALSLAGAVNSARAAGPELEVEITHDPATFQRGDIGDGFIWTITNTGDAPTSGPVTLTSTLSTGGKVRAMGLELVCPSNAQLIAGAALICTPHAPIDPGGQVSTRVVVGTAVDAPDTITNTVAVSGGGGPDATFSDTAPVIDRAVFGALDFTARALDIFADDYAIAGGHPDRGASRFAIPTYRSHDASYPVEDVRGIFVELPPGFVGNVATAPRCKLTDLQPPIPTCPPASKIGELDLGVLDGSVTQPLYNLVPEKGYPAEFGFKALDKAVATYAQLRPRTGRYGVTIGVPAASRIHITGIAVRLNGIPSVNNGSGGPPAPLMSNPSDCLVAQPTTRIIVDSWQRPGRTSADGSPDLSDPRWKTSTSPAPSVTGCDEPALVSQFDPGFSVGPTPGSGSTAAETPSGYSVDLEFPQSNDPTDSSTVFDPSVPQAPQLKDATVTLPEGVAVSPPAGDGLDGCSDVSGADQVRLDSTVPSSCPDASKIGSVVATSPLLAARDPETDEVTGAEPVEGSVYLIKPHPGDLSPDGDRDGRFRLLIELNHERYGVNVKIPGVVTADRETGRLTARFTNNPQLPAKSLRLRFHDGSHAALVNPSTCTDDATTTGVFTPWSRGGIRSDGVEVAGTSDATRTSSFAVDSGANGVPCASSVSDLPFAPGFTAGVLEPKAAGRSPFVLRITREDGEQELGLVDTTMPTGLLGDIGSVELCPDDKAAAGTCGRGSRIGSTTVGSGAGSTPLFVPQPGKDPTAVYLAGPYKGAPYSLSIVVPAQAGPFDLGTVVVRAALFVDPDDAHVTVKSDPLPTMRDGVPLRVRDVRVSIDRPGFMLSPTSCAAKRIGTELSSPQGRKASPSSHFQVGGCSNLPFKPKLTLGLTGRRQVTTGKHPGVKAQVNQTGIGEAGIEKAVVRLPKSLALDPDNAQALCEFADGTKPDLENHCPKGSIVGRARAVTPLLKEPLSGNVYFVKNIRIDKQTGNQIRTLPMIIVALRGEVAINLRGVSSTTPGGKLVNTFDNVPDAPITKFNLNINGGNKGILAVTRTRQGKINLCASRHIAEADLDGQNGRRNDLDIQMKTPCSTRRTKAAKRAAAMARAGSKRR